MEEKKMLRMEDMLEQIRQILDKMEQEDLPLEESLHCYEEGVRLIRQCQEKLKEAEAKIVTISESGEIYDFQ